MKFLIYIIPILCLFSSSGMAESKRYYQDYIIECLTYRTTESNPSEEDLVDAIYWAEGGPNTRYPYGILTKYKTTTPRQACINTCRHAWRDWDGKGSFLEFLSKRYAPIGASNDPMNLNKNWLKNVRYFLANPKAVK